MLSEKRTKKSELLIGVFIGIYGNWLISFVDKLRNGYWVSTTIFIFSFLPFLWYFQEAFKEIDKMTFVKGFPLTWILGFIYFLLIGVALQFSGLLLSDTLFSGVGLVIWVLLMQVERRAGAN